MEKTQPITDLLNRNIVLELDALTDSEAKFLVNIIMSQIYLYRKEARLSGLQHVSVIEEAHNILKKEDRNVEAKSVMDKIFREIREYGESIVIIDQMPSTLLDSAFANTSTQITLSLKHADDVRAAGKAMLLDRDEQLFLGKLPIGTAIVKLQNRWHAPFMLRLPCVKKAGKTSDDMVKARMRSCLSEPGVIYGAIPEPGVISLFSDQDKESKRLLVSIAEEPLLGIAERYRGIILNPRTGNKCKQELLGRRLVTEVNIKTPKGRIKLLDLTDRGKEALKEYGYSKSLRHGGVEHLYWLRHAKRKLEARGYKVKVEYPIGKGETVDLAIIGKDRKVAIEIETGKSESIGNIQKCLKAGFEVVSLATNSDELSNMKSALTRLSKLERKKIKSGRA